MFNTEVLREKILLLAMQGKLVQQKETDGTSGDLLKNIKLERIQQSGNKKIKTLPSITSDQMIFDIPKTWEWVHVGDIFKHSSGKALNSKNTEGHLLSYITTSNLYWNRFVLDDLREMYYKDSELEKCTAHKGDLLVCEGGDIGRAAIWSYEYDIRIQNHIHKLTPYGSVSVKFYYYCFYLYKKLGLIGGKGIALQGLSANALAMLVFPLPPVTEQIRIVEKIEEIFDLLEKIDKSTESYEQEKLKLNQKILEAAIQGKLVEQLVEEGSAEELYNQIQEEKKKLISEKRIKKEKQLAPIIEEDIPFDLPISWKWVRLSDICCIMNGDRGKNYPAKHTLIDKGIPFISALNIQNGTIVKDDKLKCMTQQQYDKLGAGKLIKGDVVLCIRGSLGKHGIYPFNSGAIASSLVILRSFCSELSEYISLYLDSDLFQNEISKYVNGVAQPNLAAKDLASFIIPLPPQKEIIRMIHRCNELRGLGYCR